MVNIDIELNKGCVRTSIKGMASPPEIMKITEAFCNAMIVTLQNMELTEDYAQCIVASAALSAAGFAKD